MHNTYEFRQLLDKARAALTGGHDAWSVQSTGERLAVALVLNRFDWLQSMDYTIAEALHRVGPTWAAMVPEAAQALRRDAESP